MKTPKVYFLISRDSQASSSLMWAVRQRHTTRPLSARTDRCSAMKAYQKATGISLADLDDAPVWDSNTSEWFALSEITD